MDESWQDADGSWEELMHLQERVDNLATGNDAERASLLQHTGRQCIDYYQRMGGIQTLDYGFQCLRGAIDITSEDDPNLEVLYRLLGECYYERYRRLGGGADLERGIVLYKKSLAPVLEDTSDQLHTHHGLGVGYLDRFRKSGTRSDSDMAIQHFEQGLALAAEEHPKRPALLSGLGGVYSERFKYFRDVQDHSKAIHMMHQALDTATKHNHERALYLQTVARLYWHKHISTQSRENLEEAIRLYQQGIDETEEGHPTRPDLLRGLGSCYNSKHQMTDEPEDLETAVQHLRQALEYPTLVGIERVTTSRKLLAILSQQGHLDLAYDVAEETVELVPQLAHRSLDNSDKQHLLRDLVGLGTEAAALALNIGKTAYTAIRLIELGRNAIVGSLNAMRVDVRYLQASHPELADQYIKLRDEVRADSSEEQGLGMFSREADRRYDVSQEFDELLEAIRLQPGFEMFLSTPSEEEMREGAAGGTIVVVHPEICPLLRFRTHSTSCRFIRPSSGTAQGWLRLTTGWFRAVQGGSGQLRAAQRTFTGFFFFLDAT